MDISTNETEDLKVLDVEYTVESEGHQVSQPIVHLFCRNADREYRHIEVEGFRPYFMMEYDEFVERTSDVINDRHVVGIEADLSSFATDCDFDTDKSGDEVASYLTQRANGTTIYHDPDTFDALDETKLVKVLTFEPAHVGKIRDHWKRTWEADIPFPRRFLISSGIYHGVRVPSGATRVRYENWDDHSTSSGQIQEIEPIEPPDVHPRMMVVDIEVLTHGGGVPDPIDANNEITAITAYDSYTEEYAGWIFECDEWETEYDDSEFEEDVLDELDIDLDTMSVYDHEGTMIEDFNEWVIDRNFDMVTGWNSNWFDYPYIVNRSYETSAYSIRDWDLFGNPGAWYDDEDEVRMNIEGLITFDMLNAYKKTQYRELASYKLEDVAQSELGMGKIQLEEELDDAWKKQPIEFMRYNVRDVQAVVRIEQSSGLLSLYDNMRQVTGALYTTCNHNGPMLDTLFLRQAYERGIALTTNNEPDQGDYRGAWVGDPVPGTHESVVYPDLASLYPYILWTLNISPETMYITRDEYREGGYEDDQMFTAYIDKRDWYIMSSGDTLELSEIDEDQYKGVHDETGSRKKKASKGFDGIFDPQFHEIYFVKPDVKEGFIRQTVDLLVDLKYRYDGEGDMYDAVKRVTNSVYGVLGDSASGGGKGFRLFDWRLAEAITLGGQKVINYTADNYIELINDYAEEEGYERDSYLVGGDTDSVQTAIPQSPSYQKALEWAQRASAEFHATTDDDGTVITHDGLYDRLMYEEFGVIPGEDEHKMEVEIESLASALFFMRDDDSSSRYVMSESGELISQHDDDAVKKRYAQHMIWDENDGWLHEDLKHRDTVSLDDYEDGILSEQDPHGNIGIKGFEYVRSDSAVVTKEAQLNILTHILLSDNPADEIYTYLSDLLDEIKSDDFDATRIGRPKGISNDLDDYGWKTIEELENDSNYTVTDEDRENGGRYVSTPSPTYRGAKYSDDHIPWEDISAGNKPMRFYVDSVRGGKFPEVYEYATYPQDDRPDPPEVEDKKEVDAIALNDPTRIPLEFELDKQTMIDKELKDKLQPILQTIGEDWDGIVGQGRQVGLDAF